MFWKRIICHCSANILVMFPNREHRGHFTSTFIIQNTHSQPVRQHQYMEFFDKRDSIVFHYIASCYSEPSGICLVTSLFECRNFTYQSVAYFWNPCYLDSNLFASFWQNPFSRCYQALLRCKYLIVVSKRCHIFGFFYSLACFSGRHNLLCTHIWQCGGFIYLHRSKLLQYQHWYL